MYKHTQKLFSRNTHEITIYSFKIKIMRSTRIKREKNITFFERVRNKSSPERTFKILYVLLYEFLLGKRNFTGNNERRTKISLCMSRKNNVISYFATNLVILLDFFSTVSCPFRLGRAGRVSTFVEIRINRDNLFAKTRHRR